MTGAALAALIYGFDRVSAEDGNRLLAGGLLALAAVLGIAAIRHARRAPHPLIPLGPLAIRTFAVTSLTGGALIKIPFIAMSFVLPIYFQIGFGMSAFSVGAPAAGL